MSKEMKGMKKTILSFLLALLPLCGWADNQGYAIFDGGTLTFKYGKMPAGENVFDTEIDESGQPKWWNAISDRSALKKVVFDPSFASARPTSTRNWFALAEELTTIEGLQYLNTSNVTEMSNMFGFCCRLTSIDLSHFDTSNVTDMGSMFKACDGLTSIDVSHFDTSNVTYMGGMFFGCSGLSRLDLGNFNTSKVTNMNDMFLGCASLTYLNVSSFDTSNVTGFGSGTGMGYMFAYCNKLTNLDLSSFNTSKVGYMEYMFMACTSLTTIDLSSFDTRNVEAMAMMFRSCSSLSKIYVGENWTTTNVTSGDFMFDGCTLLTGGKGTKYDADHINKEYARIDGGSGAPGYFTAAHMEEGVSYVYEDDGSMAVRDASESKEEVEIPSSLHIRGEVHSVEAIQAEAFMDNEKLKTVTIPETIKEIGESAFAGCTNLTDIYCYAENPIDLTGSATTRTRGSVASQVFAGVDKDVCVLWVPEGCVSAYRNAGGWGEFKQIKELKRGDANGDGLVNVADIVVVVNLIKEGAYKRSADVNNDGVVDNQDLSAISDIIMEK